MPSTIVLSLTELAKLALQMYFSAMKMEGKTEEEIKALYVKEMDYFTKHPPSTLPDV